MAGAIDTFLLEKEIGSSFSKKLQSNLRGAIAVTTNKGTGLAMKSTVSPVYKNNELFSLIIKTPYYIYPILDLGFEGSKKTGVSSRVEKRDILIRSIENGQFVEQLANKIGDIRAKAIMSRVSFGFDLELQTSNSLQNE